MDAIKSVEKRYNRLVELNVQEQCINIIKTSEVQKEHKERKITVHGWVFDVQTGKLINLEINFKKILKDIMKIYHIT